MKTGRSTRLYVERLFPGHEPLPTGGAAVLQVLELQPSLHLKEKKKKTRNQSNTLLLYQQNKILLSPPIPKAQSLFRPSIVTKNLNNYYTVYDI